MDPLSISMAALASVTVLLKTSKYLHSFAGSLRNGDAHLTSLEKQVSSLAETLSQLRLVIREVMKRNPEVAKLPVWLSIGTSIKECRLTVEELNRHLSRFAAPAGDEAAIRGAWRQLRRLLQQEDVEKLVSAVRTHSVNVQMALGTVTVLNVMSLPEKVENVLAPHFEQLADSIPDQIMSEQGQRFDRLEGIPDKIIELLAPELERLERMIQAVNDHSASANKARHFPADKSLDSITLNETTEQLQKAATNIASRASSAAGSVGSAFSTMSRPSREPAFKIVPWVPLEPIPAEEESTTGSEAGFPLSAADKTRISDWLERSNTLNTVVAEVPSEEATRTSSVDIPERQPEPEWEEDTDFQSAQESFELADSFFAGEDYSDATDYIRDGLETCDHLSESQREFLGFDRQKLHLAICCTREAELDEAEELFLSLEGSNHVHTALRAKHGLADVKLRKKQFKDSLKKCREAVKGWETAAGVGREHEDYMASKRLLAIIFWASGSQKMARGHANRLTKQFAIAEGGFDHILSTEYGLEALPALSPRTVSMGGSQVAVGSSQMSVSIASGSDQDGPTRTLSPISQSRSRSNSTLRNTLGPLKEILASPKQAIKSQEGLMSSASLESKSAAREPTPTSSESSSGTTKNVTNCRHLQMIAYFRSQQQTDDPTTLRRYLSPILHKAAQDGHALCCRGLLDAGAAADERDSQGRSPLATAAAGGHGDCCALLLRAQAPAAAHELDADGNDLAMAYVAAGGANTAFLAQLEEAGVDPFAVNHSGHSVVDLARAMDALEFVHEWRCRRLEQRKERVAAAKAKRRAAAEALPRLDSANYFPRARAVRKLSNSSTAPTRSPSNPYYAGIKPGRSNTQQSFPAPLEAALSSPSGPSYGSVISSPTSTAKSPTSPDAAKSPVSLLVETPTSPLSPSSPKSPPFSAFNPAATANAAPAALPSDRTHPLFLARSGTTATDATATTAATSSSAYWRSDPSNASSATAPSLRADSVAGSGGGAGGGGAGGAASTLRPAPLVVKRKEVAGAQARAAASVPEEG